MPSFAQLSALRLGVAGAFASLSWAWQPNFEHAGAWVGGGAYEASPIFYNGKMYLMQSMMGNFMPDNQPHGFFCIFDGASGEKISCPSASSGHSFCSAVVSNVTGTDVVWVFCSAWDRANHNCSTPGWGCGACADPSGGCYVGTFSTSCADLRNCPDSSWNFTKALPLPGHMTVPNVGVGLVPLGGGGAGLPRHQAFMALETSISVAVNIGSDGDLSQNWLLLDPQEYSVDLVGNSGLCPFARYNPVDGFYYVGGGGGDIHLARSPNLTHGSWATPPLPFTVSIERGCTNYVEDCSPSSPVARIADGLFTEYWGNGSDGRDREFLTNLTDWNFSVNDADVTDNGTHTFFIYGQCAQTAPRNFTGKWVLTHLAWVASVEKEGVNVRAAREVNGGKWGWKKGRESLRLPLPPIPRSLCSASLPWRDELL